jgi:hypothetical protein
MPWRSTLVALAMLATAAVLYAWAMVPRLLAEFEFGPICSGHPAGALHCPACYAAAALAALAALTIIGRLALRLRAVRTAVWS